MNDASPRANALDDELLVRRFQGGDEGAFEAFVARHQDRVFRLCLAHTRDRHMAEDAAQEVFLRALTGLPRFRFGAAPFTWLYRTLKNVCAELERKRPIAGPVAGDEGAVDELTTQDGAGAALDASRLQSALRALVATLPERQRDTVVLRVFEDLSVDETARALRIRQGTVKANLHKAIARLRERAAGARVLEEWTND